MYYETIKIRDGITDMHTQTLKGEGTLIISDECYEHMPYTINVVVKKTSVDASGLMSEIPLDVEDKINRSKSLNLKLENGQVVKIAMMKATLNNQKFDIMFHINSKIDGII